MGKHVIWSGDVVQSIRLTVSMVTPSLTTGRIDNMKAFRQLLKNQDIDVDVYGWSYFFLYGDRDDMMWRLVIQTLIIAAVAVLAMLAIFISFRDVLLIAVCIGCVDCSMMGMMAVWNVPMDAASFICLAMAIGLSVDYVVHLSHAVASE